MIRAAAPDDARALLDYFEAVSAETDFLSFGPGEFGLDEAAEAEALRAVAAADNRVYLLGLVEGRIAGTSSFSGGQRPRTRHAGELGIAVARAYWGLGVGPLLMDALVGWARATGIVTKLNLRVRTDNARAIALYRRKGFAVEGTISREMCLDGAYYDHHWMGLAL